MVGPVAIGGVGGRLAKMHDARRAGITRPMETDLLNLGLSGCPLQIRSG
jgi:hypothetical protein